MSLLIPSKDMKKYSTYLLIFIAYFFVVSFLCCTYFLTVSHIVISCLGFGVVVPLLLLYFVRHFHNHKKVYKPDDFSEAWQFCTFVKFFGPNIHKESHTNNTTKKVFRTLEVSDYTGKTVSIRFSSYLGELSAEELKERKEELFVGKRKDNHRWYLYDKNYKRSEPWEDIKVVI